MANGLPCYICGLKETAHQFPELYPKAAHKFVSPCEVERRPEVDRLSARRRDAAVSQ